MTYTDQQIEDGITALMDRGQNKAVALRTILSMMHANLASLVIPAGARFLFGNGQPSAAKGVDGDVYDDIISTNRYYKDAGVWTFQYRVKGDNGVTPRKGVDYTDGYTPRKGVDYRDGIDAKDVYQLWLDAGNVGTLATFLAWYRGTAQNGLDGKDGTTLHQESYDPAPADGNDGDQWQTAVSLTTERRYKKVSGAWRLFYDNTNSAVIVTPPNTAPNVLVAVAGTSTTPKFTAQAADSDGVQSIFVKVYADAAATQLVNTFGPSAPGDTSYITTWASAPAGTYYAFAVATDTKGLSATSTPGVAFTVSAVTLAPTITSFTPVAGLSGTVVTVTGTNLASITGAAFNGVVVTNGNITNNTATSVTLLVPAGVATGKITVTTAGGTATSASDFTVGSASVIPFILLSGQSLCLGTGEYGQLTQPPINSLITPDMAREFSRSYIWAPGTSDLVKLGPLTNLSSTGLTVVGYTRPASFGNEVVHAQLFENNQAGKNYQLKVSGDGQSITNWESESNGRLAEILAQYAAMAAFAAAKGETLRKDAFVWIQGQADANMTVAEYKTRFSALYNSLLSHGVIAATTLIVFAAPSTGNARTAQQQWANENPSIGRFVDISDLSNGVANSVYTYDGTHLTAEGHRKMGERIYAAIYGGTAVVYTPINAAAPGTIVEETSSLWSYTGDWQPGNNPALYSQSYAMGLVAGKSGVATLKFSGDGIAVDCAQFANTPTKFDIRVDGITRKTVDLTAVTADSAYIERYQLTGLGAGVHTLEIIGVAAYNALAIVDRVRVAPFTQQAIRMTGGTGTGVATKVQPTNDFELEFEAAMSGQDQTLISSYMLALSDAGQDYMAVLWGFNGAGFEFFSQPVAGCRRKAFTKLTAVGLHLYKATFKSDGAGAYLLRTFVDGNEVGTPITYSQPIPLSTSTLSINWCGRDSQHIFTGTVNYVKVTVAGTTKMLLDFNGTGNDSTGNTGGITLQGSYDYINI